MELVARVSAVFRRNQAAFTHGYLVAVGVAAVLAVIAPRVNDTFAYWSAGFPPAYQAPVGSATAFPYSPAAAAVLAPFDALPWPVFEGLWIVAAGAALAIMVGPWSGLVILVPFVAMDVAAGNIHILLALAIVAGFRWPAAWSAVLLTKVLPGVGLLWFALRREWRHLATALAATGLLILATIAIGGTDPWAAWLRFLVDTPDDGGGHSGTAILVPLALRLPLAVAVVSWGALTNRRWTVPVAATLALPVLWFNGLAILVAAIPLARRSSSVSLPASSRRPEPVSAQPADP